MGPRKLQVLAVTSPTWLIAAPELPTATEQGFPGVTVIVSIGLRRLGPRPELSYGLRR